jgi:hypothetical protein
MGLTFPAFRLDILPQFDRVVGMKTSARNTPALEIPAGRWLSYAAAGAATALVGAPSVDAEIHYSGPINFDFQGTASQYIGFPFDQPGDSIFFVHYTFEGSARALLRVGALMSGGFAGRYGGLESPLASRLVDQNNYISNNRFLGGFGYLAVSVRGQVNGDWTTPGNAFVGFFFNNGAGKQYGWVRVKMGSRRNLFRFRVVDYAFADPGEQILPGQTESGATVPTEGSLGLLSLGATGLDLWRQHRGR